MRLVDRYAAAGFVVGARVRIRADARRPRFGVYWHPGDEGEIVRVGQKISVRLADGSGDPGRISSVRTRDLELV